MSTYIQAFIPDTDKEFQKHKKVLLTCMEAVVSLPKETADYFESDEAYESLLDQKLGFDLVEGKHYTEWSNDGASGYDIIVQNLPAGVHKIRFGNSW